CPRIRRCLGFGARRARPNLTAATTAVTRGTLKEIQMNLHRMLLERKAAGRPVTIGLIGAGKFGLMFLSQVRQTDGMHLVGVADLNTARARSQLKLGCW